VIASEAARRLPGLGPPGDPGRPRRLGGVGLEQGRQAGGALGHPRDQLLAQHREPASAATEVHLHQPFGVRRVGGSAQAQDELGDLGRRLVQAVARHHLGGRLLQPPRRLLELAPGQLALADRGQGVARPLDPLRLLDRAHGQVDRAGTEHLQQSPGDRDQPVDGAQRTQHVGQAVHEFLARGDRRHRHAPGPQFRLELGRPVRDLEEPQDGGGAGRVGDRLAVDAGALEQALGRALGLAAEPPPGLLPGGELGLQRGEGLPRLGGGLDTLDEGVAQLGGDGDQPLDRLGLAPHTPPPVAARVGEREVGDLHDPGPTVLEHVTEAGLDLADDRQDLAGVGPVEHVAQPRVELAGGEVGARHPVREAAYLLLGRHRLLGRERLPPAAAVLGGVAGVQPDQPQQLLLGHRRVAVHRQREPPQTRVRHLRGRRGRELGREPVTDRREHTGVGAGDDDVQTVGHEPGRRGDEYVGRGVLGSEHDALQASLRLLATTHGTPRSPDLAAPAPGASDPMLGRDRVSVVRAAPVGRWCDGSAATTPVRRCAPTGPGSPAGTRSPR